MRTTRDQRNPYTTCDIRNVSSHSKDICKNPNIYVLHSSPVYIQIRCWNPDNMYLQVEGKTCVFVSTGFSEAVYTAFKTGMRIYPD